MGTRSRRAMRTQAWTSARLPGRTTAGTRPRVANVAASTARSAAASVETWVAPTARRSARSAAASPGGSVGSVVLDRPDRLDLRREQAAPDVLRLAGRQL